VLTFSIDGEIQYMSTKYTLWYGPAGRRRLHACGSPACTWSGTTGLSSCSCTVTRSWETGVVVSLYGGSSTGATTFVASSTDEFQWAQPSITDGTLSVGGATASRLNLVTDLSSKTVRFNGLYFPPAADQNFMQVVFGPVSQPARYRCPITSQGTTFVQCTMPRCAAVTSALLEECRVPTSVL
jgi:hypothetical protein